MNYSKDKLTMKDYGKGKSTGLDQTALGKIETGFVPEDVSITGEERAVLRKLAEEVAEIAASAEMEATRKLWKKHNMLENTRPLIFCDPENGWNEIITEAQMKCSGKLARRWEMDLRKEIFWGKAMGDDKPVESYFDVPYTVSPDDWGVKAVYHKTDDQGSYVWENPIKDYDRDLKKLHFPEFTIAWETTHGCLELAEELFGGLLTVRLKGAWWWSLGVTLPGAALRGLSNIFYDFIDHPDEVKEFFSFLSRGLLNKIEYLEKNNLLSLNNDGTYVGSGGYGFTDELPQKDFKGSVRLVDMWGFTESQETVNVSPDMYEEFIFPYEKPIMDRFGLNCYGCCEPLHSRWPVVKRHHNLRRISCSAWVDIEKMAENLSDHYIFSMKPNPATIAEPVVNAGSIRRELRKHFELTRDCVVECLMKDNHTIGEKPENVVEWCRIAREEAERYG
jgi:hypothetical protein